MLQSVEYQILVEDSRGLYHNHQPLRQAHREIQDACNWLGAAADRVVISMLEEDIALMYIIMKKDEIIQRLDIKQEFV